MARRGTFRPSTGAGLRLAAAAAFALPLLAALPANAQFNPCVRPQRPLLPIQGTVLSEAEKNSILVQYSHYFDDLSRYMRCLSSEMEDAQRESEESIEIYKQFNGGSQY